MSFLTMLQHRLTTYRLQNGTGVGKTYQPNLTDEPCLIQPMSAEYAARVGMTFGRSFYCYTAINADIKLGDKVIDQDGREYRVNGTMKRNYGLNQNMCFYLAEQAGDGVN